MNWRLPAAQFSRNPKMARRILIVANLRFSSEGRGATNDAIKIRIIHIFLDGSYIHHGQIRDIGILLPCMNGN